MADPAFWNNQEKAQATLQEAKTLRGWLEPYDKLNGRVVSAFELDEMIQEGSEPELEHELDNEAAQLREDLESFHVKSLLRGPDDFRDAQLEISAGAGGTEAQDWAQMLMRMYVRWAERRGFEVVMLDESEGEEAGIKGAVLEIRGQYELRLGIRLSGRERRDQHRHSRRGSPYRRVSRVGRGWAARQQDQLRGSHYPHPDKHRRRVSAGTVTVQEQINGDENAEEQAVPG
jgi:hypothetical protein